MNLAGGKSGSAGQGCASWLVIGAGGFIGTNLCLALQNAGLNVTGFDRNPAPRVDMPGCTWVSGSFLDQHLLAEAMAGADVVVHLVSTLTAANSNENMRRDVEENLGGTLELMELCRRQGVRRLIVLSSGGTIYGPNAPVPTHEDANCEPICSYGIVKLAIEKYAALFRRFGYLDSVVLRVANPYGPHQVAHGQGFIAAAIERAIRGEAIEVWGDGTVIRDYIYIDDVIDAIVASSRIANPLAPHVFNIGSGHGLSINEVLETIEVLHGPLEVIRKPGRAVDVPISVLDVRRADSFLNWRPTTAWAKGIASTYAWMRDHVEVCAVDGV